MHPGRMNPTKSEPHMNSEELISKANFQIDTPDTLDWPVIVRICNEALGENYIDSLNRQALRFYVARHRKLAILGFAALETFAAGQLTKVYPQIEAHKLPHALQHCDALGLVRSIKALAIDPKFQRRGIGTKLFGLAEAKCVDSDTNAIVAPAWRQGEIINSKRMLEARGYSLAANVADYWKDDCQKGVFRCPAKEEQLPCVCSLSLYWKLLSKV